MTRNRSHRFPFFGAAFVGQGGFSLIEMILVMVLLGIMGAGASLGLSKVVSGFMTSRDSAALTAKGQLALLRLSREFRVLKSVTASSATSIQFTALHGEGVSNSPTYTVSTSGTTITLSAGGTPDVLVDQVNSLALAYYDSYTGVAKTSWGAASRIIQLTITLNGPDNTAVTFSTRVAPRNI